MHCKCKWCQASTGPSYAISSAYLALLSFWLPPSCYAHSHTTRHALFYFISFHKNSQRFDKLANCFNEIFSLTFLTIFINFNKFKNLLLFILLFPFLFGNAWNIRLRMKCKKAATSMKSTFSLSIQQMTTINLPWISNWLFQL